MNIARLQRDEYYLFYEMMIQSLRTDDVVDGINKSFALLKTALKCGDIVLHVKDDSGIYSTSVGQVETRQQTDSISYIVNKTSMLIEFKKIFKLDLDLFDDLKNVMLIHLKTDENDYILSINNIDLDNIMDEDFLVRLRETMLIILKRAEMYERNTKAIFTDLLTGLDNRNSYETRIQQMNKMDDEIVFGIFDLFRLKYINETYTHVIGDRYIKETANILRKYWPKEKVITDSDGTKQVLSTGSVVYRVGGDEFILLTSSEDLETARIKAKLVAEEVRMIDLGIDDKPVIGLNCGLMIHKADENIKDTYRKADAIMAQDKQKMYVKHKLGRREM